jgi:RNA polymerase sigma factor (TIGR02999 family)
MTDSTSDKLPVTHWLQQARHGDRAALDRLVQALYPDLKRVARARLHQQGRGAGVETTTLVHETFLRLVMAKELRIEDRRHFFAYAARTMRHIIIDSAREMLADCRGGGQPHETLGGDASLAVADLSRSAELVRVNDALLALEAVDPALAQVVEMRYFGGYSDTEIAELQSVSSRTVGRRWEQARAWLYMNMSDGALGALGALGAPGRTASAPVE